MTLARTWRLVSAAAWTAFVCAWPAIAWACPVCFDPREPKRAAFLTATILLSLLPLGTFGAMVLFVRQKVRRDAARAEGHPGA
jgi:hypothetical protein